MLGIGLFLVGLSGCSLALDFDPYRQGAGDGGRLDATSADGGLSEGGNPDGDVEAGPPPCEPSEEICNEADDDCDGVVDEGGFDRMICVDACGEPDPMNPRGSCGSSEICIAGRCGSSTLFLEAGAAHSCAMTTIGRLFCWGRNTEGQVGLEGEEYITSPRRLSMSFDAVRHIALGTNHSCAVGWSFESAFCWGQNNAGQLGVGTSGTSLSVPTRVMDLTSANSTFAGGDTTCFSVGGSSAGPITCVGQNDQGQIGDGTNSHAAVLTSGGGGVTYGRYEVAIGLTHSCALTGAEISCWGQGDVGQLGDGRSTPSLTPVTALATSDATAIDVGTAHSCAIVRGQARCWGENGDGQLGVGDTEDRPSPQPVTVGAGSPVTVVATGASHTCAATADGGLYCWGQNQYGQLGDGTDTSRQTPVSVLLPGPADAVLRLAAGDRHTCAGTERGLIYCWGDNGDGQLGIGRRGGTFSRPQRAAGVL